MLERTRRFDITCIVGFDESRGEDLYNTALIARRGEILGTDIDTPVLCGVRAPSAQASISSWVRKLLPSMTTVSTWWRTRSRMAEVRVLSLLKICDQCL